MASGKKAVFLVLPLAYFNRVADEQHHFIRIPFRGNSDKPHVS